MIYVIFTSPSGAVAKYCDEYVSVCAVCVCVCLSVREDISGTTNHTRYLYQCLCMLPMAVAKSSSCVVAIRYVLPVLWMTSVNQINQIYLP